MFSWVLGQATDAAAAPAVLGRASQSQVHTILSWEAIGMAALTQCMPSAQATQCGHVSLPTWLQPAGWPASKVHSKLAAAWSMSHSGPATSGRTALESREGLCYGGWLLELLQQVAMPDTSAGTTCVHRQNLLPQLAAQYCANA